MLFFVQVLPEKLCACFPEKDLTLNYFNIYLTTHLLKDYHDLASIRSVVFNFDLVSVMVRDLSTRTLSEEREYFKRRLRENEIR